MKLAKHIEYWDDEREQGNGIIITLKDGFSFTPQNCGIEHVRGFDTVTEAREACKLKNIERVEEKKLPWMPQA